jgi:imidazoleglycerol-phosphate dehydratase
MRKSEMSRRTRETNIDISLVLDGKGETDIECEDQFLRHMLETLAKYASFDLSVSAVGDNDHHLIEDVAIVLGKTLRDAMGDTPIQRISHAMVPMDDALVTVAVDLIDRPYVDVECPDALYIHFFRSFAMSSNVTIHTIHERGFDEHHVVEATFKALGLALKEALAPRDELLSTKDAPDVRRS